MKQSPWAGDVVEDMVVVVVVVVSSSLGRTPLKSPINETRMSPSGTQARVAVRPSSRVSRRIARRHASCCWCQQHHADERVVVRRPH